MEKYDGTDTEQWKAWNVDAGSTGNMEGRRGTRREDGERARKFWEMVAGKNGELVTGSTEIMAGKTEMEWQGRQRWNMVGHGTMECTCRDDGDVDAGKAVME